MKKNNIFRHELNESIQANAALNCLKNRNNKQVVASQEQEEEDYTNDEIPSPNFSYRMSFMVWAMRQIIPYLKEISQVCAQADPTELKHAVMKILKTRDTGIPETPHSCQQWAKQNYDWVEMELNGEYDAYQEKWSKPFNIPSEQEESADDKGTFALKLVKKFKNKMTPDYAKIPEMFMMLKLQKALKKPLMSLSKEEYHAWAKAICNACESVFGSAQEQEEDGINKGGMHNLVQVGHIMNTPSMHDTYDSEWFSDREEQEAYYENFRVIAELVADQIDRENLDAKGIENNMDTLFEIVKEVWKNNSNDLYIYDDVDEYECQDFFDKHYEEIKNEYMKREHDNIMSATHDDLFA